MRCLRRPRRPRPSANLPLPGVGVLPVNAYLLMAEEPVLIDTGIGLDGDDFITAVAPSLTRRLRWVWRP